MKKILSMLILIIVIMCSLLYIYKDKIFTLKNEEVVNFCGKEQNIKADNKENLNLAKRIIEIATKDEFPNKMRSQVANGWKEIIYTKSGEINFICSNFSQLEKNDTLEINSIRVQGKLGIKLAGTDYVNLEDGIYTESGFDGSLYGPIGKLK